MIMGTNDTDESAGYRILDSSGRERAPARPLVPA
jgi:hypothetical protein